MRSRSTEEIRQAFRDMGVEPDAVEQPCGATPQEAEGHETQVFIRIENNTEALEEDSDA